MNDFWWGLKYGKCMIKVRNLRLANLGLIQLISFLLILNRAYLIILDLHFVLRMALMGPQQLILIVDGQFMSQFHTTSRNPKSRQTTFIKLQQKIPYPFLKVHHQNLRKLSQTRKGLKVPNLYHFEFPKYVLSKRDKLLTSLLFVNLFYIRLVFKVPS